MRVGFVYDLRDDYLAQGWSQEAVVEFDTPETIHEIAAALRRAGAEVTKIGSGRALTERLVRRERWDLVFSIAEGVKGRSREAQVPALCELFDQPYAFSDPLTMAVTLDKSMAKRLVRDAGIPTAPFAEITTAEDTWVADISFPAFVKPIAEGTGKGCELASLVPDRRRLYQASTQLISRFHQPVLAEAFLEGREFTIGIVGNRGEAQIIGVLEVSVDSKMDGGVYSLINKEECEGRVRYSIATDAEAQLAADYALGAYQVLGCRDAARLDFKSDTSGVPQFLEANPIAGLHPTHSDLPILAGKAGYSYDWLIGKILDSAARRYGFTVSGPTQRDMQVVA